LSSLEALEADWNILEGKNPYEWQNCNTISNCFFDVSGASHMERYCDTFVKSVVCLDDDDNNNVNDNNNTVSFTAFLILAGRLLGLFV
jgi:hypothetical protein